MLARTQTGARMHAVWALVMTREASAATHLLVCLMELPFVLLLLFRVLQILTLCCFVCLG